MKVLVWGLIAALALAGGAQAARRSPAPIVTTDVARFYAIYETAGGHPTAEQLDRDYLGLGSPGLKILARARNVTGRRIADAVAAHPETYETARRCLAVLPTVERRLAAAFGKLQALYPQARLAPVTIAVGRGRPVGITDPEGVVIGLEALCAADFMDPEVADRFVHVIAHEYGHVQQSPAQQALDPGKPGATVLAMSLMEGAAEFTGELISGGVSQPDLWARTRGREPEIEAAFVRDEDSTDLSAWMYNAPGDAQHIPDLGYWVGYRIVKAYYDRAPDKAAALRAIYEMKDPKAFLARSGWRPAGGSGSGGNPIRSSRRPVSGR